MILDLTDWLVLAAFVVCVFGPMYLLSWLEDRDS